MASPCVLIHTLVLSSLITIFCTVHARSEALEPDESLFKLFKLELAEAGEPWDDNGESWGNDVNEARHRVRRANVAAIRHLYDGERVNSYSQDEKDAILEKHRQYRKETGASNMNYMVWSEELAYTAGLWASVCYWGHGTTDVATNYTDTGQNLWLGGGMPTGVNAVVAWHDNEINNYIYDEAKCKEGKVCGHYTQVVWAKTSKVGCARAYCAKTIDSKGKPDGREKVYIFACHYSPGGNYNGVKPFKKGAVCTECFSNKAECYDNYACRPCSEHNEACDCRQVCYNCGNVTTDCGCECMAGWHGGSCSEPCEDTHENCYKGWPGPAYCGAHPAIPKGCPLMCSVCEPEGDEECVKTTPPTDSRTPTTVKTTPPTDSRTPTTDCTRTCKNKGTLQNDCTCKCLNDYTGERCERLIEEVESGVEIIFTANITHYTDEFELQLRETVASLVTVYCNDNFQSCCINDQGKTNGTFAFVTYNDVQTARGYPTADGTKEETFATMVIVKVPSTTTLCANGAQSTSNRRKRDLQQILDRDRREATGGAFFDQTKLLEVIKANVDTIATNLNITVDSVKAGEVTGKGKKAGSGANPGVVAGVIVVVLLVVVIITIIAILVVKRQNSLKNKTEDKDAWADKNDDAKVDQKTCVETIAGNGQGM